MVAADRGSLQPHRVQREGQESDGGYRAHLLRRCPWSKIHSISEDFPVALVSYRFPREKKRKRQDV